MTWTCRLDGSGATATVTVAPPTAAAALACVIVYTAAYAYADEGQVTGGAATVLANGIAAATSIYVEGYRDASCKTYVDTYRCTVAAGSGTPKPTTLAPGATVPPTEPPPPTVAVPPAAAAAKGAWLWDMDPCFWNLYAPASYAAECVYPSYTAYLDAYLAMLQKPWNGTYPAFTRLFISADLAQLNANAAQARLALRYVRSKGVAVELLADGSVWVKSGSGVATGMALCQQVRWWNGNASHPGDVFDGVHLDIEPHALPGSGWTSNSAGGTDAFNNAWEANLIAIFRGCRALFNGTAAVVAWDVGDWYYNENSDLWTPLLQNPYVDYLSTQMGQGGRAMQRTLN